MKRDMPPDFQQLRRAIGGEILTDELARNMLATDASMFRMLPVAVAFPKTTQDVVHIVNFARRRGISLHPRGAGNGLCGSALGAGMVVDFTRHMNRLLGAVGAPCRPQHRNRK